MSDSDIILALESGWLSREELSQMLGVPDRAVRNYIEDLNIRLRSHGRCVLSSSSRKGYHIPNPLSDEDVAFANHVLDELKSKAISIFARRQAVEDFIKFSQSAKDAQRETQLTLF
jgi:biotin operon repressor